MEPKIGEKTELGKLCEEPRVPFSLGPAKKKEAIGAPSPKAHLLV